MIKVDNLGDAHKPADRVHSVSCHVGYEAGNFYGIKNEEQQETERKNSDWLQAAWSPLVCGDWPCQQPGRLVPRSMYRDTEASPVL